MHGTGEHKAALRRLGYEWLQKLGGGGMAVVYKVQRRDNGQIFAAKAVSPGALERHPEIRSRLLNAFQAEANVWMSLSPNPDDILSADERARGYHRIAYADANPTDSRSEVQFLILQFVEGRTLDSLLEQERYLAALQAVDFGIQFCEGMIYCGYKRGAGFVHRDVKPGNMMVTRDRQLKIIDFGLSASVGHRSGLTQFMPGTPRYMPPWPEGDTPERDLYAFGVSLGDFFAGSAWDPRPIALERDPEGEIRRLEAHQGVLPALIDIVIRCLKKRLEDRYSSFESLKADLERLQQQILSDTEVRACTECHYVPNPEAVARKLPCPICGGAIAEAEASSPSPGGRTPATPPRPVSTIDLETPAPPVSVLETVSPPPGPEASDVEAALDEEAVDDEALEENDFIRIAAGTFVKGCDDEVAEKIVREFGLNRSNKKTLMKNRPERRRIEREFRIGRQTVTNREYFRFVRATGHPPPEDWRSHGDEPWDAGREDHPVVGVSWYDAVAYCRWTGGRLPTADEWERAARGTDGRPYPWGDGFDPELCNSAERGTKGTLPANALAEGASPDGLLNMTGNVAEWTVPTEPSTGGLRGASYSDPCELFGLTVDTLRGAAVDVADKTVGFRVVLAAGGLSGERISRRGMDFVRVAGGIFTYGCPRQRKAELDRLLGRFGAQLPTPRSRELELPAFYIGKYPVTNEQYLAFVEDRGWRRPGGWARRRPFPASESDHPVVEVSFEDALEFCAWVGDEARLPDSLEWEKAARGDDGRFYPWGDRFDRQRCHCGEGGAQAPAAVGSHPGGQSPYGVHDMVGNVWEWVDDYAQLRGGSFRQTGEIFGLSSFVGEAQRSLVRDDVGFRLVRHL